MSRIIGIDLGTTNSACAFVDGDEPRIIPNDRGNRLTPSVVAFTRTGDILVGEAAKNQAVVNAERTILAVKRAMGSDQTFIMDGKSYSPEKISSLILKKLVADAQEFLGESVSEAVITVPAYFNERQRRATQEAGRLAGLKVRKILNEPTAAAVAYACQAQEDRNILVYDLGGGTFDVTYLQKRGSEFVVKSTLGDNHLGGIDFDDLLLGRVVEQFSRESGLDVSSDPVLLAQLKDQVEKAKIELSSRESAEVSFPFIGGDKRPVHLRRTVGREEFEALIRRYIERTVDLSLKAVAEGGGIPSDIQSLVFSGGSSRIPLVKTLMGLSFPMKPESRINPEEIVALGAAIQASLGGKVFDEIVLKELVPLSLGVEIDGGYFVELIRKNTPIPVSRRRTFTTVSDNQTSVEIHVLQGNSKTASENASLGRFLLSGIRKGEKGAPQIDVSFNVDSDGILHVSAEDSDTGAAQAISITEVSARGRGDNPEAELAGRLTALSERAELLREEHLQSLDRGFLKEIDELLSRSKKAVAKKNVKDMSECMIAIETIVAEINAMSAEEAGFGGA